MSARIFACLLGSLVAAGCGGSPAGNAGATSSSSAAASSGASGGTATGSGGGGAASLAPAIDGAFWTLAGEPDLGPLTNPGQQPVDFAIWPTADGTWQLWSCIRGTKEPGETRLFYRWQGPSPTTPNWTPVGVAMHADPSL